MSPEQKAAPNSGRKLFFGLFIFPLLIAVGMAVLLCSVILLTHEQETPESLLIAIKSGSPGKRWQKAFELSNELNRSKPALRGEAVLKEIIYILEDQDRYDSKTRGYMAIALSHFNEPDSVEALEKALNQNSEDVQLYALWALGVLEARQSVLKIQTFLKSENESLRKTSAYVLGVIGNDDAVMPLRAALKDASTDVRWNAALALARLNDDSGFDEIRKMLERNELASRYRMNEDQIETVMTNALRGLALIQKPESIKILKMISQSDKNMRVRQAALDAIQIQMENHA